MSESIDVRARLAAMNDAFQDAPDEPVTKPLPEGIAQFGIEAFDFVESKRNGNLLMVTHMTVIAHDDPDAIGRSAVLFHDVEDEEKLPHLKKHLALLGVADVNPLDTLQDRLESALDLVVEGNIKHNKRGDNVYANVYLNRVIEGVKARGGSSPDDDIPF